MKLNRKQCFDCAMIITFEDDNIYCDYARYAFWFVQDPTYFDTHNDKPGVLVHRSTGIGEGKYMFWLENDEVYPILKIDEMYDVIEYEDDIRFYVDDNERENIEKCMRFLNQSVYNGGVLESDGV